MIELIFATGIPFGGQARAARDAAGPRAADAGMRGRAAVRGAASLDLAYVAAGRYEGYWEREIHAWDMAAGLADRHGGGRASSESMREGGKPARATAPWSPPTPASSRASPASSVPARPSAAAAPRGRGVGVSAP